MLDLIDDCIACGIDSLIAKHGGPAWSEVGFTQLHEQVRAELNDEVVSIARQVEQILTTANGINKRLKGRVDISLALALSDIKSQVGNLIYRGFVTATGAARLPDVERYLHAIERRLEKLAIDPHRDRAQMLKVEQVQQAWQQMLNKLPPPRANEPEVKEIRWMIEELRVSYFGAAIGYTVPNFRKAHYAGYRSDSGLAFCCIRRLRPSLNAVTATARLSAKSRFSAAGAEL
ncbi:ATP-dependent RNA helicase HrpA [Hafnia alvei]|uniref:ATP-dependent RNA helicase HrpA n=1 Tax=Hafnia alvei TaxID=569 RepID=A0A377PJP7_HAFAL|nr:ATP-dependent RNA helicase HrpA [Hafnia alvei]